MHNYLYSILLIFLPSLLSSQVLSKAGRFSVDYDRGCPPFEVNITELTTSGSNRLYFYGDGSPETISTTYVYGLFGTFQIIQIDSDLTPQTDTLTIQVESTETQFSLEKCNLNTIIITSEEQLYDSIRVYFTPTDSTTLLFGEQASFTYPTATTQTFQTKGFYSGGRENCTLFTHDVTPSTTLTAPPLIRSTLKEVCRDVFALTLELGSFDSLVQYEVEFEQPNLGPNIILKGKINSPTLVLSGIDFDSNQSEYCVNINALDLCSGRGIDGTSLCTSITDFLVTPFSNLYTSYENNGIFINLDSVASGSLLVYRKLVSESSFELRTTVQNAFTDPVGTLSRQYEYRIDYLDTCSEILHSIQTHPPLIDSDRLGENAYNISLQDPVNVITADTQAFYEVGNTTKTIGTITNSPFTLSLNPTDGTRQFLQARVDYENGISVFSNQIRYRYTPVIHVPKAFTPNGDQLNDTLAFFGLPTATASISIYSRWGQLIYSSSQPSDGWDGFINGKLAPEGVYLYEIIFEDSDGERVIQKGTFALLKK